MGRRVGLPEEDRGRRGGFAVNVVGLVCGILTLKRGELVSPTSVVSLFGLVVGCWVGLSLSGAGGATLGPSDTSATPNNTSLNLPQLIHIEISTISSE